MNVPLPDLFRNYGEILNQDNGASPRVFLTLVGAVLLVVVWFIAGALVQGITRFWKRTRGDSVRRAPSRKNDDRPAHPA